MAARPQHLRGRWFHFEKCDTGDLAAGGGGVADGRRNERGVEQARLDSNKWCSAIHERSVRK